MTDTNVLQITAYHFVKGDMLEIPIVTAYPQREWMNFREDHAYRCLPLTMANQRGWFLLNPVGFVAEWQGIEADPPIKINFDEPLSSLQQRFLGFYFGNGILTWQLPYLIRTPPGYNLLVRGPANWPKDGIQALEGMVESDWLDATFTMNWKFTREHFPVRFEKNEPFCMITPIQRGELERFEPSLQKLADNPALNNDYHTWRDKRVQQMNDNMWRARLALAFKKPHPPKYDLTYMRGETAGGVKAPDHQTHLTIKPFNRSWEKRRNHGRNGTSEPDTNSSEGL